MCGLMNKDPVKTDISNSPSVTAGHQLNLIWKKELIWPVWDFFTFLGDGVPDVLGDLGRLDSLTTCVAVF